MIYVSMINLIQSELFGILWNSKIDHTTGCFLTADITSHINKSTF